MQIYYPVKTVDLTINLPASKSISNRVLIIIAVSGSFYPVENLSDSDDTRILLKALDSNDRTFDMGAAGSSFRFMTAYLSKILGEWIITGNERMKERPVKILVDAINKIGGQIEYIEKEGFPPLKIFGSALLGGDIEIDGSVSSQYISALMMIAPYTQEGLKITLTGKIASLPYIYMTAGIMRDFGVKVNIHDNIIDIKPQIYQPLKYKVEADWSSASYWYAVLSIIGSGQIFLEGLNKNSYQGDSKIVELFEPFGVKTEYKEDGVLITSTETSIRHWEYDFTNEPDLVQTFAVLCCLKNITFKFSGLKNLRIKETDRIHALITELKKLGYILSEPEEGVLVWDGSCQETEKDVIIDTYNDHRMAMSFALVSLIQPVIIQNPKVVSKSYPDFWNDLKKLK